jgi:hypothetical protein
MGIYGNMMVYFQAQFIDLVYFDMIPSINAGYDTTKNREGFITGDPIDFRGCFQNVTGNEVKESNGNLVNVVSGDLWSNVKLTLGVFVKDPLEDYVYRVTKENTWKKEGEFYNYSVTLIVGDDGQLTNDVIFDKGENNFI